ncbi:MAG TPA: hypothetical protein VJU18_03900 [Vicinamibacteria bacterium]|nr:hypothetical protein [Vicinamibacteria bacterium]
MFPALLLSALLAAPAAPPAKAPSPSASPTSPAPAGNTPVILFLIDNSASLPPLDPQEKRVAALEKMFTFLQGQPYRLILFGGRHEIFVDDVSRYRNDGQWTDFYFAFLRARDLMNEFPAKTEFRLVLLTDAAPDPLPSDWLDMDVPPGADVRAFSVEKTVSLVRDMKAPLYVILVGDPPSDRDAIRHREQAPGFVLDMVRAANGAQASPLAQSLSSFFGDNGVLLKKFIYRVAPQEGLAKVEPVVRRIVAPVRPTVELKFFTYLVLPLGLCLLLLLGVVVRSFPGAGDLELIELSLGPPFHVAVDKLHKLEAGGWGSTGLCWVQDVKEAAASFTYQAPALDLTGVGLDPTSADATTQSLLHLSLDDLRKAIHRLTAEGNKDEQIYALNVEYIAQNFAAAEAEQLLKSQPHERRKIAPIDFLRAKAHLLFNDNLRKELTEPRVQVATYGARAERKELKPGAVVRIGRYGFIVKDVVKGGRKDVKLLLYYDRIPSLLGLKSWLPDILQRAFRLRRTQQRVVT